MYTSPHVKHPLFLSDFNQTRISRRIFKTFLKYHVSRKFVQWEPRCSMRADGRTYGQTDVIKMIVAFRNFANAPKIRRREEINRKHLADCARLYGVIFKETLLLSTTAGAPNLTFPSRFLLT